MKTPQAMSYHQSPVTKQIVTPPDSGWCWHLCLRFGGKMTGNLSSNGSTSLGHNIWTNMVSRWGTIWTFTAHHALSDVFRIPSIPPVSPYGAAQELCQSFEFGGLTNTSGVTQHIDMVFLTNLRFDLSQKTTPMLAWKGLKRLVLLVNWYSFAIAPVLTARTNQAADVKTCLGAGLFWRMG